MVTTGAIAVYTVKLLLIEFGCGYSSPGKLTVRLWARLGLSAVSGEESASKLIQVLVRVWFLNVVGQGTCLIDVY